MHHNSVVGKKGKLSMPIGMISSPAHVLTNKKIEDKAGCIKEISKDAFKTGCKYYASGLVAGGAVAAAVKYSPKVAKNAADIGGFAKDVVKTIFSKDAIDAVKNTGIYKSFAGLPPYAKAGIAAAGVALATIGKLVLANGLLRGAEIEGKYETKE